MCENPDSVLKIAPESFVLNAVSDGRVERIEARSIGEGVKRLGGGRMELGEPIDLAVGVRLLAKRGCCVKAGAPLLEIRYTNGEKLESALPYFEKAFSVADTNCDSSRNGEEGKRSFVLGKVE